MVRSIDKNEIKGLNSIVPVDWNFDYEDFLNTFLEADFFKAFIIKENDKIIAAGNVLLMKGIGWLGNIMVAPQHRKKGFGQTITAHMIRYLNNHACSTQLLIATAMGEPLYEKLGFKKTSEYVAFKTIHANTILLNPSIQNLGEKDLEKVCQLDQQANGEDRKHLIEMFYKNGVGYYSKTNELLGFYLPNFAKGAIIAKDENAGLVLLKIKHSEVGKISLIPIENQKAIQFLKQNGVKQGKSSSRMLLGADNQWNPNMIYAYASGYCG